uniref:Uncharacterized protein n=1 Tax=Ixodes scapularis TaxID=6945 RepID=A0A4D5RX45_IXOSC
MFSLLAVCLQCHSQTLGSFSVNIFPSLCHLKMDPLRQLCLTSVCFSIFWKFDIAIFFRFFQYTYYLLFMAASLASINLFCLLVDAF